LTVTETLVAPSEIVTVPPEKLAEGMARLMVARFPDTVAMRLVLLGAAEYVPEPPEMVTTGELLQSVRSTLGGDVGGVVATVNAVVCGQAVAPAPDTLTVIGRLDEPSDTVTVTEPPAMAADGEARRMDTMLPLTVASTLVLPDRAV
jgi:hypothetical protein